MSSDERNGTQETMELFLELSARDARVAYATAQRNARLMADRGFDRRRIIEILDIDDVTLQRMLAVDGRLMDPGCAQNKHRGCLGWMHDDATRSDHRCACECHDGH
ncbi:hypothetical protein [Microbacterium sp. JZ31]|uniref:hypothetical protein n=1 Tax=Microbacterium sp. JZ31 TaxID=1906274 RepID=UPI001932362F|nr:hypothetical protein [Microbacterium sp. JZ31]